MLQSRLDSYTSTPVRSRFAWYIATSARRSSPSASSAWSGKTATPGAGLQDEGEPVEVERGAERGDQVAGDALGADVVESATGSSTANSSPPSRAASAPRGRASRSRSAICSSSRSPARWPEGVVDRTEAVEVDQHERGPRADAFGVVQGGPGPLQQPLPVGQSGQRVAQLLLGAGAGDPQGGVERDERDGEQRQQHGQGDGDDADQRGDAEQRDRDEPLADQGGAGDGGQSAARGVRRYQSRARVTAR